MAHSHKTTVGRVIYTSTSVTDPATATAIAAAIKAHENTYHQPPVIVPPPVPPPVIVPPSTRRFALPGTPSGIVVPASIDATGQTDVSDALTNFINAQSNGTRIFLPAGAHYKMTGHGVLIRDGMSNVIIESDPANPATLLTFGSVIQSSAFVLGWGQGGCSHLTFRNLIHKGDNPDGGTPNAFHAGQESSEFLTAYHNESFIEIDSVHATDLWGHGVYCGTTGTNVDTCDHFWIHDSIFERTGLYGVVFAKMDTAWVERNSLIDIGGSPLGFEDGQAGEAIRHLYMGHNVLTRWFWAANSQTPHAIVGDGSTGMVWDDITIDSNRLTTGVANAAGRYANDNGGLVSFWGSDNHTNIKIIDNVSDVAQVGDAIRVQNGPGIVVQGNALQPSSGKTFDEWGSTCPGKVVTGNTPNP